jgi:hypothetical protein
MPITTEPVAEEMWELFSRVLTHVDSDDLADSIRKVMHDYEVATGKVSA